MPKPIDKHINQRKGETMSNGKIISLPKKVSMRQTIKNQAATIQNLIAQMAHQRRYINNKAKFECEIDCPECDGKGQTTEKDGLKLDFKQCPACKGEGRLYFQGIGEFFCKIRI